MTLLNDNRSATAVNSGIRKIARGISIEEIIALENLYNGGNQFPAALRELLLLAGGYCYVLDYGLNDSQAEMQLTSREYLTFLGRNRTISRPFYVIDVYNAGDQFLFVYLDEGKDDPTVYEAFLDGDLDDRDNWINVVTSPLTALINSRVKRFLSSDNPF